MLTSQEENGDKAGLGTFNIQTKPQTGVAAEGAAPSFQSTLVTQAKAGARFRFRILVVDDEPSIRETAVQILERGGL